MSTIFPIYIPICFYFNDGEKPEKFRSKAIYIPICFYFN